jgi:hypothetical protein
MASALSFPFRAYQLKNENGIFQKLDSVVAFERNSPGREGCLISLPSENGKWPVVRSSAKFIHPTQAFPAVYSELASNIHSLLKIENKMDVLRFNNALVEKYDKRYVKMAFHSDCALDLDEKSFICVYSCYENETKEQDRVMKIQNKTTKETYTVQLKHGSIVIFSVSANREYVHTILSSSSSSSPLSKDENKWLGVTFRTSKTILKPSQLMLADSKQRSEFYANRRKENETVDFRWAHQNSFVTLSSGDLLPLMFWTQLVDEKKEAKVDLTKNTLLCLGSDTKNQGLELLKREFCGAVQSAETPFDLKDLKCDRIFVAGDISLLRNENKIQNLKIIGELSSNCAGSNCLNQTLGTIVSIGEVPRLIGTGVYYPQLFKHDATYFTRLNEVHSFHELHESSKPTPAFRTGVYLSRVSQSNDEYHLLRCSTNLKGPTENFSKVDEEIIGTVQSRVSDVIANSSLLNHVLAQVYHNQDKKKARISRHSDKTKDMPDNGIIVFCTFYDDHKIDPPPKLTPYTTLRFRIKFPMNGKPPGFDVILNPGSVFVIPLETNRLYTHEIVPSALVKVPTRLGYVIRCSKTIAKYENNSTMIQNNKGLFEPLVAAPNTTDVQTLKKFYLLENSSPNKILYPHFHFSLNQGDYLPPKQL